MFDSGYVQIDRMEPAYLESCRDGLFQGTGTGILGNILVTTDNDARYAVYLNNPNGPSYTSLDVNKGGRRAGIIWPTPTIEVDPATKYDYERLNGTAGDLVIVNGRMSIIAVHAEQVFHDSIDIPLWVDNRWDTAASIGFKAWRLVSLSGEGERRIIYTRPMLDKPQSN